MTLVRRRLGALEVPVLCLGTAGWGAKADRATAHRIADVALELGINFFDTAEGYPAPMTVESHGQSELLYGEWLARTSRDRSLICSKVYGPSRHFRDGRPSRLDPQEIILALEASLKRLGTDYLDLYLIHWPDSTDYDDFLGGKAVDRLREQAHAMGEAVRAGKIRAWGLSNTTRAEFDGYATAAMDVGAPAPDVVQNRFSLWGDPEGMAGEAVPLMAYGVLNQGHISPDDIGPGLAHALTRPSVRSCCISSTNPRHLRELVDIAAACVSQGSPQAIT